MTSKHKSYEDSAQVPSDAEKARSVWPCHMRRDFYRIMMERREREQEQQSEKNLRNTHQFTSRRT